MSQCSVRTGSDLVLFLILLSVLVLIWFRSGSDSVPVIRTGSISGPLRRSSGLPCNVRSNRLFKRGGTEQSSKTWGFRVADHCLVHFQLGQMRLK